MKWSSALLSIVSLFSLSGPALASDGSVGDPLSFAALVDDLVRPGAARTGLALLGAIGIFRLVRRRGRGGQF